jgi:glycosyltransferase involved in cell wall biosynthesis
MNDLISVIIPVYNHAHTVEASLDSLLAQDYRPLEVIVIDDGSTDNFSEVWPKLIASGKYAALKPQMYRQSNAGAPAARNYGFKVSNGLYVIFWDADTMGRPDMLSSMKSALDANPGAAYAYSGFKFGWKQFPCRSFDAGELKRGNFVDVTSLIRRGDFPGFDESLKRFQDWDLWLTLLEKNKIGVGLPKILYTKLVGKRKGISSWLPSFAYRLPWKSKAVKNFEQAKQLVQKKHHLPR